uniref:Uncharacterized protein n=1 Tax=Solanum lycopersicum TaxID=4081 RepID=A0A3Q7G289_SOLLC
RRAESTKTLRHWRELHLRQATNQLNISFFWRQPILSPCCEGPSCDFRLVNQ